MLVFDLLEYELELMNEVEVFDTYEEVCNVCRQCGKDLPVSTINCNCNEI